MAPEAVLITRPDFEVAIEVLPSGGATFFQALVAGQTLGEACLAASAEDADIPALIGLSLTSGAFSNIDLTQESDRS